MPVDLRKHACFHCLTQSLYLVAMVHLAPLCRIVSLDDIVDFFICICLTFLSLAVWYSAACHLHSLQILKKIFFLAVFEQVCLLCHVISFSSFPCFFFLSFFVQHLQSFRIIFSFNMTNSSVIYSIWI